MPRYTAAIKSEGLRLDVDVKVWVKEAGVRVL